jgi:dTDP-4-dehydrorhamnose reductase
MKKILLTGAHGMLGSDFIQSQGEKFQIIGLGKSELDITNVHQIEQKTIEHRPDIILNCAAYTNVELAEVSQKKYCFDINTY